MEPRATGLTRITSAGRRKALFLAASLRNRFSNESLLGDADVVVSLTSHGSRLQTVHAAIETIAAGTIRPRRFMLWVDDESEKNTALRQPGIKRLVHRGLEIAVFRRIGPHSKYYPYVALEAQHTLPLVTADDDILYDRRWLSRLLEAHLERPDIIHCYRAHQFSLDDAGRPSSYRSWELCSTRRPSFATFLTGVSGVIYPARFLEYIKNEGEEFLRNAPSADDVWLNSRAVKYSMRVSQLEARARMFPTIVGSQKDALWRVNAPEVSDSTGLQSGNDAQIRASYDEDNLRAIASDLDVL